jgi:oligopeptide/dipeptide ABC transporter ATP-binding protein
MTLVELNNVTFRYHGGTGARPVLDGIDLAVEEQAVVAVVGESGCGKTTLGRLAAGLLQPTTGSVSFEGRDVRRLGRSARHAYRRGVQVVHQDPYASLNPASTIGEALAPGLRRHHVVRRGDVRAEMLRLLELVGLDATSGFLRRYPHQLSGGQRQRVVIARAISLRPRLLVADEAVSMLDVSVRVAVLDVMLALRQELGASYLFVSHDFGVVRYFAAGGRVVVMFYGVIVEDGPADQVIGRPQHPYSWVLLESIPLPDPRRARARHPGHTVAVDGAPAARGCVFSARCPFAEAACREQRPPLVDLGAGHRVACFFPERVPRLSAASPTGNRADGGVS